MLKTGIEREYGGCGGNDIYGEHLINALHENNVSVANVLKRGTTTGIGIVQILESGDYCSTIIKGANYLLNENDISDNLFDGKPLVILQSEIPSHIVEYVIKVASMYQCKVILNNAPARSIAPSTLSSVDYLVVNETEASFMAGSEVSSIDDAHSCAAKLHKMVRSNVIITLGEKRRGIILG